MLKGFRDFVIRGNVVDLAIGVVIGAAFGGVVASFTADVLTPIIGAIVGKPDFSAMIWTINGSPIAVGKFLNALIAFLLVAAAVYYFVVLPMNKFTARFKKEVQPDKKKCPECLSDIPIAASRCAYCTSTFAATAKV